VWFVFGDFTTTAGVLVHGDLKRFFAGDATAGAFMTGFFPVMMFGLPAACLAMYRNAKPENRALVGGVLLSMALTSFSPASPSRSSSRSCSSRRCCSASTRC
jgi:PTS system N-acetylglucosamine-specific IIC component